MKTLIGVLQASVWFILCVFMGLGMIFFAILFALFSFLTRKLAWKELSIPSFRFAK